MDIKTIPKLDLHCHLDGSLTKAMMERHLGKTIPEDALTVRVIMKRSDGRGQNVPF